MESTNRQGVLAFVAAHPGCHLRELERALPVSLSAIRHHLRKLEKAGLVQAEFDRRFRRYYPASFDRRLRRASAAFHQPPLRNILVLLLDQPGLRHADVAKRLGIPGSSLTVYLRRLRDLELVRATAGPPRTLELVDPAFVAAAAQRFHPSLVDRLVSAALKLFEATDRRRA